MDSLLLPPLHSPLRGKAIASHEFHWYGIPCFHYSLQGKFTIRIVAEGLRSSLLRRRLRVRLEDLLGVFSLSDVFCLHTRTRVFFSVVGDVIGGQVLFYRGREDPPPCSWVGGVKESVCTPACCMSTGIRARSTRTPAQDSSEEDSGGEEKTRVWKKKYRNKLETLGWC